MKCICARSAETYSSLGYGDIYPLGDIRLLASITPLIGILLLGWSGAFLFSLFAVNFFFTDFHGFL